MTRFVRARHPESFVRPVAAALHELDPTLVVSNVRTIESAPAESLARERTSALMSTSFGVGGLLLAALGLYGLLVYRVVERTKDIGIVKRGEWKSAGGGNRERTRYSRCFPALCAEEREVCLAVLLRPIPRSWLPQRCTTRAADGTLERPAHLFSRRRQCTVVMDFSP